MRPATLPTPPPLPDTAPLHAFLAEIGLWLCGVRVWLAELGAALGFDTRELRRALRADLKSASRDIEMVLFLLAVPRLRANTPLPMGVYRTWKRYGAPTGFRRLPDRISAMRAMRRVFASSAARGNLRGRLARLDDLLAHRERWIARLVARVGKGPHGSSLALVVSPHARCVAARAFAPATEAPDTS